MGPDGLRYEGGKTPLVICDILAVDYGVHGSNFNPSVRVRYRDDPRTRSAYFEDGRAFGYAGFLSDGTRRLAEAIPHSGVTRIETKAADKNKREWIVLAACGALLILTVALRVLS